MVIYMKFLNKVKKIMLSKRIKSCFKKIKEFIIKYKYIILMCLPFILIDLFTFLLGSSVGYVNYRFYAPLLFDFIYIGLFVGISANSNKIVSRVSYLVFGIIFIIIFLVNNVYFSLTKTFFDFRLMESASEGAPYFLDTLKNCNIFVYICFIIIIIAFIIGYKNIPIKKKNNYKNIGIVICSFVILHLFIPVTLGHENKELTWSSWKNPRNIYISFNDNNKSMKISGIYEYSVRNFYMTFLKTKEQENQEDIVFLDESYALKESNKNKYTGKFKGNNIIFLQLEGIDKWLVTEEDTPTLYNMINHSYNFTNHYSYYNGGGSTFNSEFAVNTGFITPLSYNKNAYTFNKNDFPNSMAHIFKNLGYSVNAFHMNSGEYYSRKVNYLNWGYDNYYGLIDMFDYKDKSYELDRELILNEDFSKLMFPDEGNFVDYIITYSAHMPFTNTKGVCKMLYNEDIDKKIEEMNSEIENEDEKIKTLDFVEMSEEECARRQAKETDYMVSLLLDKLREKDLLDNTVIVAYADHYLYTIEDQSILAKYKETDNNLINNTPFFIWKDGMKKKTINKVTSQLNILPTVLNLFGISYNQNDYIQTDALDSDYEPMVFFSDYSWYDGNVYVYQGEVSNGKSISNEELENKNHFITRITKKNDLTLKFDYFKKNK